MEDVVGMVDDAEVCAITKRRAALLRFDTTMEAWLKMGKGPALDGPPPN
jgi:hypothetical protein